MRRLLLATCSAFAGGDADDQLLVGPLAASNVEASFAVWDDPDVDWTAGPVVLRSTWDYPHQRDRFLRWIRHVPVLHNPPEVVEWNTDKVYLADLDRAGVPVVPTELIAPGEQLRLRAEHDFVVKPSVGAGSRGVGRFGPSSLTAARTHVEALHDAGRVALVQPYLSDVDQHGETALIYLAGAFSHAIRKGAMLPGEAAHDLSADDTLFVAETVSACAAAADELEVGEQALDYLVERFGAAPLYARVDVLPGYAGPVVAELELVEPSLFLGHSDGAADRFAAHLAALA